MKHKGKWFDPKEGVALMTALIDRIEREKPKFGLLHDNREEILIELKECRDRISDIEKADGKFHLGIVL
jgi:hypothetical protein